MFYITGDCHTSFDKLARKNLEDLPFEIGAVDYVITHCAGGRLQRELR